MENKAFHATPEGKLSHKRRHLQQFYGMSIEEHRRMYAEQNGCCKICGEPVSYDSRDTCVDHSHKTGKIRGILCGRCNRLLGYIETTPHLVSLCLEYAETEGGQ